MLEWSRPIPDWSYLLLGVGLVLVIALARRLAISPQLKRWLLFIPRLGVFASLLLILMNPVRRRDQQLPADPPGVVFLLDNPINSLDANRGVSAVGVSAVDASAVDVLIRGNRIDEQGADRLPVPTSAEQVPNFNFLNLGAPIPAAVWSPMAQPRKEELVRESTAAAIEEIIDELAEFVNKTPRKFSQRRY